MLGICILGSVVNSTKQFSICFRTCFKLKAIVLPLVKVIHTFIDTLSLSPAGTTAMLHLIGKKEFQVIGTARKMQALS